MSGEGKSRGTKGGVMSSLRKLVGGGKSDDASGPNEDELVLDGGIAAELSPRRVPGILNDDVGDDALVLGPTMRDVAADSGSDDGPSSDQASESPDGGETAEAAEAAAEAAEEVAEVAAEEVATESGDESGDEFGDETADDSAETEPAATAADKLFSSFYDRVREDDVATDDVPTDDGGVDDPETDDLDAADPDTTDGGVMQSSSPSVVEMSDIFSGLAVDEGVDYGGEALAAAVSKRVGEDAAGEPGAPGFGAMPDPAELEETIRWVIRDELSGEMGQRLSKNIQRLIRDEIARALGKRD